MATLTTYAVIQGVDRLTGPLKAMAAQVRGMNSAFASTGRAAGRMGRDLTYGFSLPAALGIGAILREAKEFSKFELGVSISQLGDNTNEAADGFKRIKEVTKKIREDVIAISKDMGVSPTRLMAGAETGVKLGLSTDSTADYARRAAQMSMIDPEFAIEEAVDFLGVIASVYKYIEADAKTQKERVMKSADMVSVAANESRLSLGTLQEGVRQYLPLASIIGMDEQTAYAMSAGAVRTGFGSVETGTALKSGIIKALTPTRKGMGVLQDLGVKRSDFMDFSANRPDEILAQIKYLNKGLIDKGEGEGLLKLLKEGKAKGLLEDPEFNEKFLAKLFKAGDARTEDDRDSLESSYWNAINAGGGKFDFLGFMEAIKAKGITPAQLSQLFDMRQSARLTGFLEQMEWIKQLRDRLGKADGSVLEGGQELYSDSLYGQMERTAAAWERLSITLAASPAMATFAEALMDISDALSSMDPRTLDLLTKGIIGMAAAGPALWVTGNAMKTAAFAWGLMGTNFAKFGLAKAALKSGDLAKANLLAASSFSALRAGIIGVGLAAAAYLAYENWDTIVAGAERFSEVFGEEMSTPLATSQWAEFTQNLKDAAAAFEGLTGLTLPKDADTAWLDANTAAAWHLANALKMALYFFNGLARVLKGGTGTDPNDAFTESFGRGKTGPPSITGGVLDNPSLPKGTSQPFTSEEMLHAKGPSVGSINLESIKAWLTGVINVRVTGKVDGATTTTTVTGALGGDAKGVKMNTGTSMPDLGGGGL